MADPAAITAASSTVATLFAARAREWPARRCLTGDGVTRTYAAVLERVKRLAGVLTERGIGVGDRVAVLARNRTEYVEIFLAAGWVGAIVACQNWRLAPAELTHTLDLVAPAVVFTTEGLHDNLAGRTEPVVFLGEAYEQSLADAAPIEQPATLDPEAPLLILYTSGTTGLPKGAVISHRAEIVRNLVVRAEYGIAADDAFVAWSPLYHMGGAEYTLGTLMSGGAIHVVDGFDVERLAELVATEKLGWLLLMPGMVGRFADHLEAQGVEPAGVQVCGVMPDLVPLEDLARITRILDAPYANTFGATETGNPPASASMIEVGARPSSLAKVQSAFCEVRLVDPTDPGNGDVPDGEPGELLMRGPTLFSGYWQNREATAEAFRNGWFHMGDLFVRNADGSLSFVDRSKYMIKSGGENIYPAEIERVLLSHPHVQEAAVVRQPDPTWGEVPIAFVARSTPSLGADALLALCKEQLASFKKPKGIVFIEMSEFPRSASGKVRRHDLEDRLPSSGEGT